MRHNKILPVAGSPLEYNEGMANRSPDWFSQARHDLDHAQIAMEAGNFDWACFASHQAAEKAVKALLLSLGMEGWGHAISRLLNDLARNVGVPEQLHQAAIRLDRHYIPTRYPNGFDSGAPHEYFLEEDALGAIRDARDIFEFVKQSLG